MQNKMDVLPFNSSLNKVAFFCVFAFHACLKKETLSLSHRDYYCSGKTAANLIIRYSSSFTDEKGH